jgi:hypothetical protein
VQPGHGWPPSREVGGLILGGLGARVAQGRRQRTAVAVTWFWRPRAAALLALAAARAWYQIERGAAGQRRRVIIGLAGFALLA